MHMHTYTHIYTYTYTYTYTYIVCPDYPSLKDTTRSFQRSVDPSTGSSNLESKVKHPEPLQPSWISGNLIFERTIYFKMSVTLGGYAMHAARAVGHSMGSRLVF